MKFAVLTLGAAGLVATEYYLYYTCLRNYTETLFKSTKLKDLKEYQDEVLIDTGSLRFLFKHKGGSTVVSSLLHDTYSTPRFSHILSLQYLSALCLAIGSAKSRPFQPFLTLCLLTSNLLVLYPELHSGLNLMRLAVMVSEGNEDVYANLNEVRFVQRMEEAASPVKTSEKVGLGVTLGICCYFSPILTVLALGGAYSYRYRDALARK